ncbi:DUF2892 domain-containing protein [Catalinimonas sp. 4WD22]|uniref:YgaP family membrane protein n=1 Tax=Catalinimonas locisalis TaxID=3133978 RepID=UPI0031019623
MKRNMGISDRAIRVIVALLIVVLIYSGTLSGAWAIVLGAVGGIFVLTSIMGFCPLYVLFGVNTCPAKKS